LGMGDVVSLVEKAQETIEKEEAERMMKRFQKGRFDMNDLRSQLEQMMKMGGMQGVMGMLPGMGKLSKQLDNAQMDDSVLKRQIAIIQSMTKVERRNPDLMQASRKKRVAAGAGVEVQDVNKLLKMHRQMAHMMKKMGNKGFMRQMMSMMGGGGLAGMAKGMGAGAQPSAQDMQQALSQMPQGFGSAGGLQLPPNLSGFGKK
jgi:signal recognition particle subunit SRP54